MIRDIIASNENIKPYSKEIEKLKKLFPSCFNKNGFDLDKFSQIIKSEINITNESYELKFLGKSYAKLLASLDTESVIIPDDEHNNKQENIDSQNVYISGDNLDALKHLLKSYYGKIKCIYIDPPYNTGSDGFVYQDNFKLTKDDLISKLAVSEEQADRILNITSKGSSSHSAWLMFMYPRLMLARELLTDDGVIFISINDVEQANLKMVCDDIFGESNFAATIPWRKRTAKSDVPFGISQDYEWILVYAKSDLFVASVDGKGRKYYETPDYPNRPWRIHDLTKQTTASERPNSNFTIVNPKTGEKYPADPNNVWRITKESYAKYYEEGRIVFPNDYDFLSISKPKLRYWKEDDVKKDGINYGKVAVTTMLPKDIGMYSNGTEEITNLFGLKVFPYPKPTTLIKYLIKICTSSDSYVLDFFSGSGTTAHATMEVNQEDNGNRKFIVVQLQEHVKEKSEAETSGYKTIDQIGINRIIKAGKSLLVSDNADTRIGFKHYTLKSDYDINTVDKLFKFDPNALVSDDSIYKLFGLNTILTTWLIHDGYGFTNNLKEIKIGNYTAYICDNHLYLIEPDLSEQDIVKLFDMYGSDPDFNPQNIVVFGYNFTFIEIENLKNNLKVILASDKNLQINIQIRY